MYNRAVRPSGKVIAFAAMAALALAPAGCSLKRLAINTLGDALSESGATYASDDDPELVAEALPFALKLIESILEQSPEHRGLLTAAASGFTQYAYAFVDLEADRIEEEEYGRATEMRARAKRLYLRARDHGLRGLESSHEGISEALLSDPEEAARAASTRDLPLLYWTASSWGLAIAASKDDPELIADLPVVEALIRRALELDEEYDHGALHEFMISLEGGRSEASGGSEERARRHFERALTLSEGKRASPFVTFAETVSVGNQDREEFVTLTSRALAVDPDARPEWRLSNLVMQRRARWLLENIDLLFLE
jgi:predicted anti-sigma-YlaC factor YlaD